MKFRAVPILLALALSAAGAAAAAAQIPGLPRPGQRPAQRPVRPADERARPAADTTRPAMEADSVIQRLMRLEGYVPTRYSADSAEYLASDRTLRLRGASRVEREGNVITAEDSIVYREPAEVITAYGKPQGTPVEGEPISGDVFIHHLGTRRSTVLGARTKIAESGTWYVHGDVTDERGQRVYAANSTFTSDDREEPAYHFKADRVMVIRNRILIGRPAYLYFRNVPVMALPFIVQDLESGRRSGVLIPQFEINDIIRTRSGGRNSRGTGREIANLGYYWAINDYMGLQLAARWRSESYTALRGNYAFNFKRRFLNGGVDFEQFWQKEGPRRFNISGNLAWALSERTSLNGTLAYAASSEFERNRTVDPYRQTEELGSNFALTRRFDWGNFSLNAERRQSIANDDVAFSPQFTLQVNPVTIFPGVVANVGVNGRHTTNTAGDPLARRIQTTEAAGVGGNLSLTVGNLTVSTSAAYTLDAVDSLRAVSVDSLEAGIDSSRALAVPGRRNERVALSVGTGYQIPLFASTRVTPSVSYSMELARAEDTRFPPDAVPDSLQGVFGELVRGPPRLNVGASLNTDLYGFFPGFGPYTAVRHHVQPLFSWRYSPAASESDSARARVQRRLFGAQQLSTQNALEFGINQTFEAKVRDPEPVEARAAAPGDSAVADSALSAGNRAQPSEPRKITLLAINTSVLSFSFEDLDSLGTRFRNEEISNSVRTDLLGGMQFSITHDLFSDRLDAERRVRRGTLSPFLTSFNTSFSLGQNSALFRWLGFARATEEERRTERGQTPDSAGVRPSAPLGGANFTGNNQAAGGGPWNLSLNYSMTRARRSAADTIPGRFDRGNSQLGGTLSFSLTRNWAASWNTQYSITDGTFSVHRINLKRDLYRWQANFDYLLAPNGNTSFSFSVHLIDLPDLKADYNERSIGVDRPQGANSRDR
ncbi:MAG TPA: putative LPS assembly protein LptD [Longimicrobiaceae bacterium]|nr:putative LPS assembly protein LptD [Longimicrobiaceae bacterium]